MSATPLEILRDVFGYPEFREPQGDIIAHIVGGGDALVLMPTGGGKSLCYVTVGMRIAAHPPRLR